MDGYFANKKHLDEAVRLDLHPLTLLRCDADCRLLYTGPPPKRRGARRKYDGKVDFQDLRRFESLGTMAETEHLPLYTAVVWHVTLKRQRRLVVVVNRKAPAKPRYIVLASTDLARDGPKLGELYGARVQIEFLFRDSQQFTGLSDCQARAEAALDFHFNAALFCAIQPSPISATATSKSVDITTKIRRVCNVTATPPLQAQPYSTGEPAACQSGNPRR